MSDLNASPLGEAVAMTPVVIGFWLFIYFLGTLQMGDALRLKFRQKPDADAKRAALLATVATAIFAASVSALNWFR